MITFIPKQIVLLCTKALELNIESAFVKDLIRLNKLLPDPSKPVPDAWPYPLKVRTLGAFELFRDDKPLVFSGKVQQKPLAMLKAVIALGGREVSDEALTDALWPDAEGDLGRRSFDTTLHRLRKLVGDERIIQLRDGKVSIDERFCWVDVRAFEESVRGLEFGVRSANSSAAIGNQKSEIMHRLEQALRLYRGHFLAGSNEPWALSYREHLRSEFMGAAVALGRFHMDASNFEKAADVFLRGLAVDDLSEGLYQNLMLSYLKQGRKAEAATTYRRCREVLSAKLGLTPSSRTEEVYRMVAK